MSDQTIARRGLAVYSRGRLRQARADARWKFGVLN
jgi:hypothetical protein